MPLVSYKPKSQWREFCIYISYIFGKLFSKELIFFKLVVKFVNCRIENLIYISIYFEVKIKSTA